MEVGAHSAGVFAAIGVVGHAAVAGGVGRPFLHRLEAKAARSEERLERLTSDVVGDVGHGLIEKLLEVDGPNGGSVEASGRCQLDEVREGCGVEFGFGSLLQQGTEFARDHTGSAGHHRCRPDRPIRRPDRIFTADAPCGER